MHYYQIISELKDHLKKGLVDNSIEVILFGSQIDGRADNNSDYDILIITSKDVNWKLEKEISDLCLEIELKYEILMDIHILSKNEIDQPRGQQPIFSSALKNGVYA